MNYSLTKSISCVLGLTILLGNSFVFTSGAKAQTSPTSVQISCSGLKGNGSFSNPIVLGLISRSTSFVNCPRLTSGASLDHRYFIFTLPARGSSNSAAGAVVNITPTEPSAVHPRIASPSGATLLTSVNNGFWVGNPNTTGILGRFIQLNSLPPGNYILGVEKLDSPLRSQQTPNFSLVIVP